MLKKGIQNISWKNDNIFLVVAQIKRTVVNWACPSVRPHHIFELLSSLWGWNVGKWESPKLINWLLEFFYPLIYLSIYYLSIYYLSFYLLSIYLFICRLSIYLSIIYRSYHSISSIYIFIFRSIFYLSIYLSICLSVYLSICLSFLSIYKSFCLSIFLSFY